MQGRVLDPAFYLEGSVVDQARQLLGMVLVTAFHGGRTSAVITETEAYAGVADRASHAHGGRRTRRTEPMYAEGGTAYVYLCYGIHHLFNVVVGPAGTPHAVLVRAGVPVEGVDIIRSRRAPAPPTLGGPGTLAQGLGIRVAHTGMDLFHGPIVIEDHGYRIPSTQVLVGPRVGVDYAGDDALLPYRFRVAPSWSAPWVQ
jgi:DNA-3-methyladenine glycosylase